MKEHPTGRLAWLDAAKGVAIVLVVIGHTRITTAVRDPIYAFHMPFFFLTAGYVAKAASIRAFAVKQWHALAVPYIAFLTCLMVADPLIEWSRGHAPMFKSIGAAIEAALIGGSELHGPLTVFWFVPCLMIARMVQVVLYHFWPNVQDWRWALAMALMLVLGVWWGRASNFSPLGVIAVPIALVYLWLGSLWRSLETDKMLLLLSVVLSAVTIAIYWPLAPLNMKIGDYGWRPYVTLPVALILSLALCWFMRWMAWRPFVALGKMSLVIMFLHVPVIHYLRPYFGLYQLTALAIAIPVIAYYILSCSYLGRRFFLGDSAA